MDATRKANLRKTVAETATRLHDLGSGPLNALGMKSLRDGSFSAIDQMRARAIAKNLGSWKPASPQTIRDAVTLEKSLVQLIDDQPSAVSKSEYKKDRPTMSKNAMRSVMYDESWEKFLSENSEVLAQETLSKAPDFFDP